MLRDFEGSSPKIAESAFVDPNAIIIGNATIAQKCSIWPGAIIRADINTITIGEMSNVQEFVSIHVESEVATKIGNGVTIGHSATLHGCEIDDFSLIGIGSIILDRSKIGHHCMIGAGSLIPPGKTIPPRSLVMGSPGKIIRELSDEECKDLEIHAQKYFLLSEKHKGEIHGKKQKQD
ncbi:MAG TPA: gamma carbonic anhydrase family protein [Caldisericia bacterium]|nr:gamma carbonic anhydrase family protein [Caldisericia bacterium]HOR46165.1 gamma carbonic anhydrase family protein [Caldisericia bacterium]HOU08020.1 gamma carbonic anhydrase family protein [Caldisericia bacterium]HQG59581.1 gamma carbonic anhydrase family protein [Caldisericia bacterium]HQH49204.1 gamma carbonic anhydrase family protein [Caldisericia bacterium]